MIHKYTTDHLTSNLFFTIVYWLTDLSLLSSLFTSRSLYIKFGIQIPTVLWDVIKFSIFFSSCDSIDKLKTKLPLLEKDISDGTKFKDFYQFTFNYAKNPGNQ